MSVNHYKPHILVLPEDDANRQIANGFLLESSINARNIQILIPAGGWLAVLEKFNNVYKNSMGKFPERVIVLIVDCDRQLNRAEYIKSKIDESLHGRVCVLGVFSEPEELKSNLRISFETIGKALAKDCVEDSTSTWSHALIKHNSGELARMRPLIKSILFG